MIRLDKYLADCGCGSRKQCKTIIRQKRVRVNDIFVTKDDQKIDEIHDKVCVDTTLLQYQKNVYILLHKPQGVVSATRDGLHQTVLDLIPEYAHRSLFPLGRLDKDTEGLLLISDDGELAHRLLAPKHHVEKEYYVVLDQDFPQRLVAEFAQGVTLEDGDLCRPASIINFGSNHLNIILHEGKYHQIKRMFAMFDLTVVYLKRIRFQHIILDADLTLGQYRLLTEEEISRLKAHI